jgi:hypothetical protein
MPGNAVSTERAPQGIANTLKIRYYRLLDYLQSTWNQYIKTARGRQRWGKDWRNKTRSGRTYRRVQLEEMEDPQVAHQRRLDYLAEGGDLSTWRHYDWKPYYRIRPEPGWEWSCPNCKTRSFVTESMMPDILIDWERIALKCKERGLPIPRKPTAATAGCTNCKYRPGAPE